MEEIEKFDQSTTTQDGGVGTVESAGKVIGAITGDEVKTMTVSESTTTTTTTAEVENSNIDIVQPKTDGILPKSDDSSQIHGTVTALQLDLDIFTDGTAAATEVIAKHEALNGVLSESSPSLLDLQPVSLVAEETVDTKQNAIDLFGLTSSPVEMSSDQQQHEPLSSTVDEKLDLFDASSPAQQPLSPFIPSLMTDPTTASSQIIPLATDQIDKKDQHEQSEATTALLDSAVQTTLSDLQPTRVVSHVQEQLHQVDVSLEQNSTLTSPSTMLPELQDLNGAKDNKIDATEHGIQSNEDNETVPSSTATIQDTSLDDRNSQPDDTETATPSVCQTQVENINDLQYDDDPQMYDSKVEFLEIELAKAQSMIERLQMNNNSTNEDNHNNNGNSSLLVEIQMELQTKLQAELNRAAEAEERARSTEKKLKEVEIVNKRQEEEIRRMEALRIDLENQRIARTAAENDAKQARERVTKLERESARQKLEIQEYEKQLVKIREKMAAVKKESIQLREAQEEHQRLEMSANSRLDVATKKAAEKAELAGRYEDLMVSALKEKDEAKAELQETQALKQQLEQELHNVQVASRAHIIRLEKLLEDEKKLNEERKQKMKLYIDGKAEELRQAKEDNESVQIDLAQTNKSLVDYNARYQQLHNQWVQAQTRNRELQRDLNRIKKDSENLHKVGDTLEMKLSRSATETEEHKNKRLAAKQELMTLLRTLDTERQITSNLKDSLKFKFTPNAVSHQQALNDSANEFERQLVKLAMRLGKPPPTTSASSGETNARAFDFSMANGGNNHNSNSGESDAAFHIAKLEYETKRVTDAAQRIKDSVDLMRQLVDASGDRTCYTVLTELITPQGLLFARSSSAPVTQEGEEPLSGVSQPVRRIGLSSHRYGQVPLERDH